MHFDIVGPIRDAETIAAGRKIREYTRLVRCYGSGRWRKRKGVATVRLADGSHKAAELHWYEATGPGAHEFKIKRYLSILP